MSGALAERDFAHKLERVGFVSIEILDRTPWGIDRCSMYPLFDDELIGLMRRVIPADQQGSIGNSIVIRARLGTS